MSEASDRILGEIAPEWAAQFERKAQDYGDGHEFLGVRGQFSDMNRKFQKLKRFMWDDPMAEPVGESLEEILFDMIGHCFLTIDLLRQERRDPGVHPDTYVASLERAIQDVEDLVQEMPLSSSFRSEVKNILERIREVR